MNAHLVSCLRSLLLAVRYSEPKTSMSAFALFHQLLLMHRLARSVDADQYIRLMTLAANACRYALEGYKRDAISSLSEADIAALSCFTDAHPSKKEN